ncbi:MAG: Asp-tRNA(Asn)/Glu-tRNA(Gln) amidotransferase subunit GatA [Chloroflexi bacterium]|nr:Asp-tRNA(Asn)/Glu-tRNA(Gln) amidotransferase subunit GatA [Chloroflexota bacterium]
MQRDDLCDLNITQLAPLVRGRRLSPVELCRAYLDRIQALDGTYHCFITVMADSALEQARTAEREVASGTYRGPLHGIPVGLKDLFYTQGVRTTAGSRILADFIPREDAGSVARLKAAGGIILGKLNLHEFAYGPTGINPHYGTPANPWDLERIPGGSSSGSAAALMARLLPGTAGSDTGGSIRIPASLCGCVGLKPTYGRVSRHGTVPVSWTLDHMGPLARTVEDCAVLLQAMAGHDPGDPSSSAAPVPNYRAALRRGVRGLRAGVPKEHFFDELEDGVRAAVRGAIAALEDLGVAVQEVSIPAVYQAAAISSTIQGAEAFTYHQRWLKERPQDYSPQVRERLLGRAVIPAVDYLFAQQARVRFIREFQKVMQKVDVLVIPTSPVTAPRVEQSTVVLGGQERPIEGLFSVLTRVFNIAGMPAISVPCGFDGRGLPVGLQIAGRPFEEATVLLVAHAYEQATQWHASRPKARGDP